MAGRDKIWVPLEVTRLVCENIEPIGPAPLERPDVETLSSLRLVSSTFRGAANDVLFKHCKIDEAQGARNTIFQIVQSPIRDSVKRLLLVMRWDARNSTDLQLDLIKAGPVNLANSIDDLELIIKWTDVAQHVTPMAIPAWFVVLSNAIATMNLKRLSIAAPARLHTLIGQALRQAREATKGAQGQISELHITSTDTGRLPANAKVEMQILPGSVKHLHVHQGLRFVPGTENPEHLSIQTSYLGNNDPNADPKSLLKFQAPQQLHLQELCLDSVILDVETIGPFLSECAGTLQKVRFSNLQITEPGLAVLGNDYSSVFSALSTMRQLRSLTFKEMTIRPYDAPLVAAGLEEFVIISSAMSPEDLLSVISTSKSSLKRFLASSCVYTGMSNLGWRNVFEKLLGCDQLRDLSLHGVSGAMHMTAAQQETKHTESIRATILLTQYMEYITRKEEGLSPPEIHFSPRADPALWRLLLVDYLELDDLHILAELLRKVLDRNGAVTFPTQYPPVIGLVLEALLTLHPLSDIHNNFATRMDIFPWSSDNEIDQQYQDLRRF